jgi:hypothetical protein
MSQMVVSVVDGRCVQDPTYRVHFLFRINQFMRLAILSPFRSHDMKDVRSKIIRTP